MIGVVHLVWGPLGVEPLREFLQSYRRHTAGVEHELVVLFNGVGDAQRPTLLGELEGVGHRLLELEESVQDLVAYEQAAQMLDHNRLCFLNSYSVILAPRWLEHLSVALDRPDAGLVGATGSWASLHSGVLNALFLPSPYRSVMPPRRVAREQFRLLELERRGQETGEVEDLPRRTPVGSVLSTLRSLPGIPEQLYRFEGFPAHHLRTNAFMVDRAIFTRLRIGNLKRKMDAYAVESGRNSLTRQVQRLGLQTLVVTRDGRAYSHECWPLARTLWQGDQEGLLVSDNQTRTYAGGDTDRRRLLSAFAWGPEADPSPPLGEPAMEAS